MDAYREADRRAPAEDKAEIAARLGWLAKETGNTGAANRYFARSRGALGFGLTIAVIILTAAVSLIAENEPSQPILQELWLDRFDVRQGELYRLLSVTLVHGGLLHLFLNMYALWVVGPIVEQIWGRRLFVLFYVLTAIAASTASFLMSPGAGRGRLGRDLRAGRRAPRRLAGARSRPRSARAGDRAAARHVRDHQPDLRFP